VACGFCGGDDVVTVHTTGNFLEAIMAKMIFVSSILLQAALWLGLSTTDAFTPSRTTQMPPVVICPGFGNDRIDYYEPLQQPREAGLVSALERRGFDPELILTVPVERKDWLRVAGGLLDKNFYTNSALPTGKGYGWYLKRLRETVDEAYEKSGGERVLVIGHSAGGWLARATMGDGVWCPSQNVRTAERVACLATIGAIHKPPVNFGSCVTRGALAYTNQAYPGAFLADEGVGYVSVGGDAIFGDNTKQTKPQTQADGVYATRGEGSSARVAFTSYEAVCGQGDVTGDGVVPLDWTVLEGARHVPLEGVLHSINEAGTTLPTNRWYGSEAVIDRWLPMALEEASIRKSSSSGMSGLDLSGLQRWASEIFQ
jgi:pimeloyl-ACP methyl ester carboxylesterase